MPPPPPPVRLLLDWLCVNAKQMHVQSGCEAFACMSKSAPDASWRIWGDWLSWCKQRDDGGSQQVSHSHKACDGTRKREHGLFAAFPSFVWSTQKAQK